MKYISFVRRCSAFLLTFSLLITQTAPAFAQLLPTDTTPPVISAVATLSILSNGGTITWITDELVVSTFEYGTTMSYGSSAALPTGLAIGGTAVLTSLLPSTAYYYCIHAADAAHNASQHC